MANNSEFPVTGSLLRPHPNYFPYHAWVTICTDSGPETPGTFQLRNGLFLFGHRIVKIPKPQEALKPPLHYKSHLRHFQLAVTLPGATPVALCGSLLSFGEVTESSAFHPAQHHCVLSHQRRPLQAFLKIVSKVEKEGPAPPKAQGKAKALKAKKAVLKGIHSHSEKEDPQVTQLLAAQDTAAPEAAQVSSAEHAQRKPA